jgi:hypothetical protein
MECENATPFPAQLLRAQLFYRDLLMCTVVCKATFRVEPDGKVVVASEQEALTVEDQDTPLGLIPSDLVPIKERCDLTVYGHAFAPGQTPAPSVRVHVRIGGWSHALVAMGERRWEVKGGKSRISEAKPFLTLPLHYNRAYGGKTPGPEGFEFVWHDNPYGIGLIAEEDSPAGRALPNIEVADQLITKPQDRPPMACLGALPRDSALRGMRGFVVDIEAQTTQMLPLAFNHAHPQLLLASYPAGERVEIEGMTMQAPLRFVLPPLDLMASVDLGGRRHALRLTPDSLSIFPATSTFTVVARRAFIYQFLPERLRTIRVARRDAHDALQEPTDTIPRLKAGQGSEIPVVGYAQETFSVEEFLPYYPLTSIIDTLPVCASA